MDEVAVRGAEAEADAWDVKPQVTALHIALWNGDLDQIESGLREHDDALETRDPRGNRALHLALKFAHRNSKVIVKRLLDAGARVRSRDREGWKTVHHAIASENEDIMRLLIQKEKEQAPELLQSKIAYISPRLGDLPDFYCEICIDVSTWIPGVSRWLPSDTVKIWKRGPDLRFDITLVGFDNGSWQRGNLSFLLLGNDYRFLCMDHDERTCTDLLCPGNPLDEAELDSMVHFLMTTSIITTNVDVSDIAFQRKRSWLVKSNIQEDIGMWMKCDVYDMTGMVAALSIRKPQNRYHMSPASTDVVRSIAKDALEAFSVATRAPYVQVTIDAKSEHVVSIELSAGELVQWCFNVDERDIGFAVRFLPDGSDQGLESWEEVVAPKRVPSSGNEHSGQFEAAMAGTAVFVWDNSYSLFRQKRLHFKLTVGINESESTASEEWDSHRATEELITFDEWFGIAIDELPSTLLALRPRKRNMVHKQPPSRTLTKAFPATIYMSEAFPMSVREFLPVIEVLSKTTSAFENVQQFFTARLADGFPVQFCFPLVPSVSATFRFDHMTLESPDAALFDVPLDYTLFREDVLSPRTHHEMLQNLAAV